jgi:hypothetical protein
MISPTKQGRQSELVVAADLTKHGYDVYLGFSGHYDMIAMKNEMRYTIEVKTSSRGRPDYHRVTNAPDLLALVCDSGIKYFGSNHRPVEI